MPSRAAFVARLSSSAAALAVLCACAFFGPHEEPRPPVVQTPPPSPPPPPIAVPQGLPPIPQGLPQGLPQIPQGLPQLPQGLPPFPQGLPQLPAGLPTAVPAPGQSLLSTRPPPDYATLAAPPPGALDPQGHLTLRGMTEECERVYQALRASLPADARARVATVPFHVVTDPMEPNAAAGCTPGSRAPIVFITTAMLILASGAAETRAYDELAGTHTYEAYAQQVVTSLRSGRPLGPVPAGLLTGPLATDPRRLARARHLFTQQVAFILGHEIAHHHRGHTGCTHGTSASREDAEALQRGLADAIPTLEQPSEIEADMWGITSVLEAGHAMPGGAWSDEGALLNLDVFRHLSSLASGDLEMVFLSTHPPSELRAPIVQSTAQSWAPGRAPLPTPTITDQGVQIDLGGGGAPITIPLPR